MATKNKPETLTLAEITAAFERLTHEEELALEEERLLSLRLSHARAMAMAGKRGENAKDLEQELIAAQARAHDAITQREALEALKVPARYLELKQQYDSVVLHEEAETEQVRLLARRIEKLNSELNECFAQYRPLKARNDYSSGRINRVQAELDDYVIKHREALVIAGLIPSESVA